MKLKLLVITLICAFVASCSEQSYEVLTQASVAIENVESPTSTTIIATFYPNESCAKYRYAIGSPDNRDVFLSGIIEGIQTGQGEMEVTFDGLTIDTQYTIYAIAYDSNGETGAISSYNITSYDAEASINTIYVGANSAAIEITANSVVYRVDYAFGEPGLAAEFAAGNITNMVSMTETTYKCLNYYDLEENTEYTFYTKVYDRRGDTSGVIETPIVTSSLDEIPSVSLELGEITAYEGTYTFTCNDLCSQYYLLYGAKDDWSYIYDGGYGGNVFDMIVAWAPEDWGVVTVTPRFSNEYTLTTTNYNLTTNSEMQFFVVACDSAGEPYALQQFLFTTPAVEAEGEATVTIELIGHEVSGSSVTSTFLITPNEHTLGSLFATYSDSTYYDYWIYYPDDLHSLHLQQWQNAVLYSSSDMPWSYGNEPFYYVETGLIAGRDYCVVVTPVSAAGTNNGGWGADVVFDFTTPLE